MKTLEEEAKEYATENNGIFVNKRYEHFIAGANSKHVQVEKIKAQIEVCETILKKYIEDDLTEFYINKMISELKQQLKQLEDEK